MKKLFVFALAVMASCSGGKEYKPAAQGAPYEIIVVAGHDQWNGAVGDTLRSIFNRRVPMINAQEPMFDVLRVLPEGFNRLVTRHRNVLVVSIDKNVEKPSLALGRDVYSAPQTILTAKAPDNASLATFLGERGDDILMLLEHAEKERDVAEAQKHTSKAVKERIREKFGFDISTGPGFKVRSEKDDFLWISNETPTASQGIIIYTYPFEGSPDLSAPYLLARRDRFVKLIPGENPGSHMISNHEFIEMMYKTIQGRSWAEMHGFWDVARDNMGGPFVNYSTLDAAGGRIVAIDLYVYAPDRRMSKQRNLKNELMHYIYTVKF